MLTSALRAPFGSYAAAAKWLMTASWSFSVNAVLGLDSSHQQQNHQNDNHQA